MRAGAACLPILQLCKSSDFSPLLPLIWVVFSPSCFAAPEPGFWRLHISCSGQPLPRTPFSVHVADPAAKLEGPAAAGDAAAGDAAAAAAAEGAADEGAANPAAAAGTAAGDVSSVPPAPPAPASAPIVDQSRVWEQIAAAAFAADGSMDGWDSDSERQAAKQSKEVAYIKVRRWLVNAPLSCIQYCMQHFLQLLLGASSPVLAPACCSTVHRCMPGHTVPAEEEKRELAFTPPACYRRSTPATAQANPNVPVVENLEDLWMVSRLQNEKKRKEEQEKARRLQVTCCLPKWYRWLCKCCKYKIRRWAQARRAACRSNTLLACVSSRCSCKCRRCALLAQRDSAPLAALQADDCALIKAPMPIAQFANVLPTTVRPPGVSACPAAVTAAPLSLRCPVPSAFVPYRACDPSWRLHLAPLGRPAKQRWRQLSRRFCRRRQRRSCVAQRRRETHGQRAALLLHPLLMAPSPLLRPQLALARRQPTLSLAPQLAQQAAARRRRLLRQCRCRCGAAGPGCAPPPPRCPRSTDWCLWPLGLFLF